MTTQTAALTLAGLLVAMGAGLITVALAVPDATTATLITGMLLNLALLLAVLLGTAWPTKER